jgi:hypothetical protein
MGRAQDVAVEQPAVIEAGGLRLAGQRDVRSGVCSGLSVKPNCMTAALPTGNKALDRPPQTVEPEGW